MFFDLLVFKALTFITFKRINGPYKIYISLERCNFVQAICTIFEIIQSHINAKTCAEVWRKCIKIHVHCNKLFNISNSVFETKYKLLCALSGASFGDVICRSFVNHLY